MVISLGHEVLKRLLRASLGDLLRALRTLTQSWWLIFLYNKLYCVLCVHRVIWKFDGKFYSISTDDRSVSYFKLWVVGRKLQVFRLIRQLVNDQIEIWITGSWQGGGPTLWCLCLNNCNRSVGLRIKCWRLILVLAISRCKDADFARFEEPSSAWVTIIETPNAHNFSRRT